MGLLEWAKDSWNSVKQTVGNSWNTVKTAISSTTQGILSGTTTLYNDGKSAITALHSDAIGFIKEGAATVRKEWDTIENLGTNFINKGGDTLSSIASSFSLPLTIGAIGLGAFFLFSKK